VQQQTSVADSLGSGDLGDGGDGSASHVGRRSCGGSFGAHMNYRRCKRSGRAIRGRTCSRHDGRDSGTYPADRESYTTC
jgi:hypothetical protein